MSLLRVLDMPFLNQMVCRTASLSDGINANNQSNVVLKGIIGIGAMSKISSYTGHTADETNFVVRVFRSAD